MLTDAALRNLKPKSKIYKASDRDGMYVTVSPSGTVNRIVIAGRDSAQDSINQVGQEITRRNMNIQPTLTIRPGLPVRVIVNRDLVLRPYQPLFFNRGASQ